MLKITKDMKPDPEPKPWIDIELKQFTLVNYDALVIQDDNTLDFVYTAEVKLTEEQAREIVKYMNENIWKQNT